MPQNEKPKGSIADDLPDLTASQAGFVQDILSGMTASDAYRHNYDVQTDKPESVWRMAIAVRNNVKVQSWIAAARREKLTQATYTIDDHIKELDATIQEFKSAGAMSAAGNLLQAKGKAIGAYLDRTRDESPHNSDTDLISNLQALFGKDLALEAARRLGYDVEQDTEQ